MSQCTWPDSFDPAKQRAYLDSNGKAVFTASADAVEKSTGTTTVFFGSQLMIFSNS